VDFQEIDYERLIDRARDGDDDAVNAIVTRYEPEIRRSVRAFLGPLLRPYVDSTDIAQSIYMTLLAGLRESKFDLGSPEKLVALATRMAKLRVADHWRKIKRRDKLLHERVEAGDLSTLVASATEPADDPARIVAHLDQVEHALSGLEDLDRRALELRLLGHSTAEAAAALGMQANVLRARLSRLRQRLRDEGLLSDWV